MSGKGKPPTNSALYLSDPRLVKLYDRWLAIADKALATLEEGELAMEPKDGQRKIDPLVKVAETATTAARMLAGELGLTAAAIARGHSGATGVDPGSADTQADIDDDFAGRPGAITVAATPKKASRRKDKKPDKGATTSRAHTRKASAAKK